MVKTARPKVSASKRPKKMRKTNPQRKFARKIGATANRSEVEQKQIDQTGNLAIAATSASWSNVELLNGIGTGTLTSQRVGRKVVLKKCAIRWIMDAASPLISSPFRILVVYDKAPNGVLPAITDILNANSINGHVNLNNSDRFMILKDFYPTDVNGQGYSMIMASAGNGSNGQCGKFTLNFGAGLQEQFLLTNATIADISSGALYLAWCMTGRQTTNAGSYVLSYSSRVRFTDV